MSLPKRVGLFYPSSFPPPPVFFFSFCDTPIRSRLVLHPRSSCGMTTPTEPLNPLRFTDQIIRFFSLNLPLQMLNPLHDFERKSDFVRTTFRALHPPQLPVFCQYYFYAQMESAVLSQFSSVYVFQSLSHFPQPRLLYNPQFRQTLFVGFFLLSTTSTPRLICAHDYCQPNFPVVTNYVFFFPCLFSVF